MSVRAFPYLPGLAPGTMRRIDAEWGGSMKQILEAWTRWLLTLTFDLWRYPDAGRKEKESEPS